MSDSLKCDRSPEQTTACNGAIGAGSLNLTTTLRGVVHQFACSFLSLGLARFTRRANSRNRRITARNDVNHDRALVAGTVAFTRFLQRFHLRCHRVTSVQEPDQFFETPDVIRQPRFHRWRHAERTMYAAEVVTREVQRN
jgi:hypothetical protein